MSVYLYALPEEIPPPVVATGVTGTSGTGFSGSVSVNVSGVTTGAYGVGFAPGFDTTLGGPFSSEFSSEFDISFVTQTTVTKQLIGANGTGAASKAISTPTSVLTGVHCSGSSGTVRPTLSPDLYTLTSSTFYLDPTHQIYVGRTTPATYFDTSGTLRTAPVNGPRPTSLGTLMEPASINHVQNNTMVGASLSSGPTGWNINVPAGLTITYNGTTTSSNGVTLFSFTLSGTLSANGVVNIDFAPNNPLTNLPYSTTLAQSVYVSLTAGILSGISAISHWGQIFDSTNAVVIDSQPQFTPTSTLTRYTRYLTTPSTGNAPFRQNGASVLFYITAGAPVNATFSVGAPQLEIQPVATSIILTNNTGIGYRDADSYYQIPLSAGTGSSGSFGPVTTEVVAGVAGNGAANAPIAATPFVIPGTSGLGVTHSPSVTTTKAFIGVSGTGKSGAVVPTTTATPLGVKGIGFVSPALTTGRTITPAGGTGVGATGTIYPSGIYFVSGVYGTGENSIIAGPTATPVGVYCVGYAQTVAITISGVPFSAGGVGNAGSPGVSSSFITQIGGVAGLGTATRTVVGGVAAIPNGVYGTATAHPLALTGAPGGVSGSGFAGAPIATVGRVVSTATSFGFAGISTLTLILLGVSGTGFGGQPAVAGFVTSFSASAQGAVGNFTTPTESVVIVGVYGSGGIGQLGGQVPGVYATGAAGATAKTTFGVTLGVNGFGYATTPLFAVIQALTGTSGTGGAHNVIITGVALGAESTGSSGTLSTTVTSSVFGTSGFGTPGSVSTPSSTVYEATGVYAIGVANYVLATIYASVAGNYATGTTGSVSLSLGQTLIGVRGTGATNLPHLSFITQLPGVYGVGWAGTPNTSYELTGVSCTTNSGNVMAAPVGVAIGVSGIGGTGNLVVTETIILQGVQSSGNSGSVVPINLFLKGVFGTGVSGHESTYLPGPILGASGFGSVSRTTTTGVLIGTHSTGVANSTLTLFIEPLLGVSGAGVSGQPQVLPEGTVLVGGAIASGFANAIPTVRVPSIGAHGSGFSGTVFFVYTGVTVGVSGHSVAGKVVPVVGGAPHGVFGTGFVGRLFTWPVIRGAGGKGVAGSAAATYYGGVFIISSFVGSSRSTNPAVGVVAINPLFLGSSSTYYNAIGNIVVPVGLGTSTALIADVGIFSVPIKFVGTTSVTATAEGSFSIPFTLLATATQYIIPIGNVTIDVQTDGEVTSYVSSLSYPTQNILDVGVSGETTTTLYAVGEVTLGVSTIGIGVTRRLYAERSTRDLLDENRLWVLSPDSRLLVLTSEERDFELLG